MLEPNAAPGQSLEAYDAGRRVLDFRDLAYIKWPSVPAGLTAGKEKYPQFSSKRNRQVIENEWKSVENEAKRS